MVTNSATEYGIPRRNGKSRSIRPTHQPAIVNSPGTTTHVTGPERNATILILTKEVLGAGLLGALVEAEGAIPCYALGTERAELAVARLRPTIVLVDAYHAAARTEAFFEAARAERAHITLFAPSEPWKEMREIADRWDVPIVHPRDGESLAGLIRTAIRRGLSDT